MPVASAPHHPRPTTPVGRPGSVRAAGLASPLPIAGSAAASAPGPIGRILTTWLPPLLAAVSWGIGLVAAEALGFGDVILWALLPTLATLVIRLGLTRELRRWGAGHPRLIALFVLHQAVLLVAVALNPLACIYAFVGYLDAPRFLRGRAVRVSVVLTALICALGQTGGFGAIAAVPALFLLLVFVNVLLSLGMMHMDTEREREVVAREAAARELARATSENAALHEELVRRARENGVAEERARLAREIHDTVAQGLVGVIRQLEAVPQDGLERSARQRILTARDAARESLVDARRAVDALAPQQLEGSDPLSGLAELVARWSRAHRVVTIFDADEAPDPVPHPHALVRVVQEALSNVARHASAGTVEITIGDEQRHLVLRIADDGRGFDPEAALDETGHGHGLAGMRSRIRETDGTLTVDSAPGAGTVITARVPR
ncbi:sensor histidine kinase [Brachybacterium endophyticum]|uniref:Oxygen sensor histidine kinase NreB n=1 Tax=Brachybacterium endophyticum TaxID=2182385 RepID=A0A2U2RIR4_9MICO|nr:sensor histidine kinase [Brachybacterium endophyticum]PWH05748.1 sensor histidine kinase [Brachybacterium endophyticum]